MNENTNIVALLASSIKRQSIINEHIKLSMEGYSVLILGGFGVNMSDSLSILDKEKIAMADVLLILNDNGYMERVTNAATEYALTTNTVVEYAYQSDNKSSSNEVHSHIRSDSINHLLDDRKRKNTQDDKE